MVLKYGVVGGLLAGLPTALVDFIIGAVLAFAFWGGPPPGMFQPETVSATYFLLAKVGIGVVLGMFYGVVYGALNPSLPGKGLLNGLFYGFLLFIIIRGHELSFTVFFAPLRLRNPKFWWNRSGRYTCSPA